MLLHLLPWHMQALAVSLNSPAQTRVGTPLLCSRRDNQSGGLEPQRCHGIISGHGSHGHREALMGHAEQSWEKQALWLMALTPANSCSPVVNQLSVSQCAKYS